MDHTNNVNSNETTLSDQSDKFESPQPSNGIVFCINGRQFTASNIQISLSGLPPFSYVPDVNNINVKCEINVGENEYLTTYQNKRPKNSFLSKLRKMKSPSIGIMGNKTHSSNTNVSDVSNVVTDGNSSNNYNVNNVEHSVESNNTDENITLTTTTAAAGKEEKGKSKFLNKFKFKTSKAPSSNEDDDGEDYEMANDKLVPPKLAPKPTSPKAPPPPPQPVVQIKIDTNETDSSTSAVETTDTTIESNAPKKKQPPPVPTRKASDVEMKKPAAEKIKKKAASFLFPDNVHPKDKELYEITTDDKLLAVVYAINHQDPFLKQDVVAQKKFYNENNEKKKKSGFKKKSVWLNPKYGDKMSIWKEYQNETGEYFRALAHIENTENYGYVLPLEIDRNKKFPKKEERRQYKNECDKLVMLENEYGCESSSDSENDAEEDDDDDGVIYVSE